LADGCWQTARARLRPRFEAVQAGRLEAGEVALQRAHLGGGLHGAFAGRLPEEEDWADDLLAPLAGRVDEQLKLLPVVGYWETLSGSPRHTCRHSGLLAALLPCHNAEA